MGQIVPFFRRRKAFDSDMTAILAAAYENAIAGMPNREQPQAMREIAARRILALASRGERNPDRLCAAALVTLNNALPRLPEPAIRIPVQES